MVTLNLHDLDKSDIKFKLNRFPDGEVQVTDLEIDKLKEGMKFIAPIRNAEELFIFIQIMHLIHNSIHKIDIIIPYLMGARNDRTMDKGRSTNLYIVLFIISNTMFPKDTLTFLTVHNEEAVSDFFDGERKTTFLTPYNTFEPNEKELVIFPDAGAERRFKYLVKGFYLVAEKSRDINQSESRISEYKLLNPMNVDLSKIERVVVIDDLVDGGRTFKLLSAQIESVLGKSVTKDLYLTHFIQEEGLLSLIEFYNNIYVCDTFRPVPAHSSIHKLKNIEEMI